MSTSVMSFATATVPPAVVAYQRWDGTMMSNRGSTSRRQVWVFVHSSGSQMSDVAGALSLQRHCIRTILADVPSWRSADIPQDLLDVLDTFSCLVVASDHRNLRCWRLVDGRGGAALVAGHASRVTCSCYIRGRPGRIATGSQDSDVLVWDCVQGRKAALLAGHRDTVTALASLSEGRIVSSSLDGTLRVWDTDASRQVQVLTPSGSIVHAVANLAVVRINETEYAVSLSLSNFLSLWNLRQLRFLSRTNCPDAPQFPWPLKRLIALHSRHQGSPRLLIDSMVYKLDVSSSTLTPIRSLPGLRAALQGAGGCDIHDTAPLGNGLVALGPVLAKFPIQLWDVEKDALVGTWDVPEDRTGARLVELAVPIDHRVLVTTAIPRDSSVSAYVQPRFWLYDVKADTWVDTPPGPVSAAFLRSYTLPISAVLCPI